MTTVAAYRKKEVITLENNNQSTFLTKDGERDKTHTQNNAGYPASHYDEYSSEVIYEMATDGPSTIIGNNVLHKEHNTKTSEYSLSDASEALPETTSDNMHGWDKLKKYQSFPSREILCCQLDEYSTPIGLKDTKFQNKTSCSVKTNLCITCSSDSSLHEITVNQCGDITKRRHSCSIVFRNDNFNTEQHCKINDSLHSCISASNETSDLTKNLPGEITNTKSADIKPYGITTQCCDYLSLPELRNENYKRQCEVLPGHSFQQNSTESSYSFHQKGDIETREATSIIVNLSATDIKRTERELSKKNAIVVHEGLF